MTVALVSFAQLTTDRHPLTEAVGN